jgi:uncharacterized membrane protein HdeD (DUF308 family)
MACCRRNPEKDQKPRLAIGAFIFVLTPRTMSADNSTAIHTEVIRPPTLHTLESIGLQEVAMPEQTPAAIVRHASSWALAWGVLLIVFGVLAIGSPLLAAVAVTVVISWLIMFAGAAHLVLAFRSHRAGSVSWKLLVGLAYVFFGAYLIMHPLLGVASLTLVIAALFLIEGVLDIILFSKMRLLRGATWVLADGIITLLLGLLIYIHWPSSSAWAIGTLVGVSMVISGISAVMLSLAVRKTTVQAA